MVPLEIKVDGGTLTAGEDQLAKAWRGAGVEVSVVRCKADVARLVGLSGYREDSVKGTEF